MQEIALAEFQRWRNASVDERRNIAFDQFFDFNIRDLMPDLAAEDLASVAAPNGKLLGECSPQELREMLDWCEAIGTASREVLAVIDLRRACNA